MSRSDSLVDSDIGKLVVPQRVSALRLYQENALLDPRIKSHRDDIVALESWLKRPERLHIADPIYVGTGEVATIFSVTTKTVTRWCEAGVIPNAKRIGGPRARWAIPASWVYKMLEDAQVVS